jgi:hypothetical protein
MRIMPRRQTGGCRFAGDAGRVPTAQWGCTTGLTNENYPVQLVG